MNIDHAKVRRESMRWAILLALYNARPEELCEQVIQSVMHALYPDATPIEVRREMEYLRDRKLITIRKEPHGQWWGDLSRYGTDIAEYTIECEPGIARPKKYWGG